MIRIMNGLSIQEMAQELGISTGAVKMRLIRAGIHPNVHCGPTGVYPHSALDKIRNVAAPGRPKGKSKP